MDVPNLRLVLRPKLTVAPVLNSGETGDIYMEGGLIHSMSGVSVVSPVKAAIFCYDQVKKDFT